LLMYSTVVLSQEKVINISGEAEIWYFLEEGKIWEMDGKPGEVEEDWEREKVTGSSSSCESGALYPDRRDEKRTRRRSFLDVWLTFNILRLEENQDTFNGSISTHFTLLGTFQTRHRFKASSAKRFAMLSLT